MEKVTRILLLVIRNVYLLQTVYEKQKAFIADCTLFDRYFVLSFCGGNIILWSCLQSTLLRNYSAELEVKQCLDLSRDYDKQQ